jgi:hypothetical protein
MVGDIIPEWWAASSRIRWAACSGISIEGVAVMQLRDGLITEYREVANVGPAFVALGFAPERVCKLLAREGEHLRRDPSYARHLA